MCYTMKQYRNRLEKLLELDRQIKELEKQRDQVADDIKSDMGDIEKIIGSDFCINYSVVIQNRFDTKAFKVSHSELYQTYMRPQETRRFTYKMEV